MTTKRYTLSKEERLSWKRYIDLLFEKGQSFVAFPLRVVYLPMEEEMPARASFLVSVPKKKFKRAVKRNLIKRQVLPPYTHLRAHETKANLVCRLLLEKKKQQRH